MKRWMKWTVAGVTLLVLLLAAGVTAGRQLAERRRMRQVSVSVLRPVAYSTDAAVLERGRYLFESRGCAECHGTTGAGREFANDGKGTRLAGPDITAVGATARYRPVDWDRTIRHGVKPGGQPVLVMPSVDYNRLTDDDLTALVSYVRSLPPAGGAAAVIELPLPAWVLYGYGMIPDAARQIDHSLPPAQPVPAGVNASHGAYVANMCVGCHGAHFSGGRIPGAPPAWPPAANLTPGEDGALARYRDAAQFTAMLRSGRRPDGTVVSRVMPFESLGKLDDVDAQALYAFLQTLPARPPGQR